MGTIINNFWRYGWAFGLSVCLYGCTEVETESLEEHQVMAFHTSVSTRASESTLNRPGKRIGVIAGKSIDGEHFEGVFSQPNQKMEFQNDGWHYAPICYWDRNAEYFFQAYYPFRENGILVDGKTLHIEDVDALSQEDIMLAPTLYRQKGDLSSVIFQFSHLLTNVNVMVCKSGGWPGEVQLTSLRLKGMKTKGDFSYQEEQRIWKPVGPDYNGDAFEAITTPVVLTESGVCYLNEMLMIPQPMSALTGLELGYKHQGEIFTKEIIFLNKGIDQPWKTGKQITYIITVAPNQIGFEKPQVLPWGSVVIEGGEVIL